MPLAASASTRRTETSPETSEGRLIATSGAGTDVSEVQGILVGHVDRALVGVHFHHRRGHEDCAARARSISYAAVMNPMWL
jgi:hypothetical protein